MIQINEEMTLEEKIDYLIASHERILAMLSETLVQVQPTLDSLMNSPIVKMLGGSK